MKNSIVIAIIVVLFLVGFGGIYFYYNILPTLNQPTDNVNLTAVPIEYVDRDFRFSMYSPAGWTKDLVVAKKLGLKVMFVGPIVGNFVTNVNVGIGFIQDGVESIVRDATGQLKDYAFISYQNKTISNLPAKEWTYASTLENYRAKTKQVFITKNGNFTEGENLFMITYVALEGDFDKYYPAVQKSIESFKFV